MNDSDDRERSYYELSNEAGKRTRKSGQRYDRRNDFRLRDRLDNRRQRRKRIVRRLFILLLLLLMFLTGAFGALADNPITLSMREQFVEYIPAPYLKYYNSFLRAMSEPPIESAQADSASSDSNINADTSQPGVDVVGFLINLFSKDRSAQQMALTTDATPQTEVTSKPIPPTAAPTVTQTAAQPTLQPTLPPPTSAPATATPTPTVTATTAPPVFAPPRKIANTPEPADPVDTITTSLTATTPTNGAVNVAITDNIVLNFNEAVNVIDASFTINCGGGQAFAISGSGTATITLDPTASLPAGTICTVTVIAAQVSDTDGIDPLTMATDYAFTFTTAAPPDTAPSVTSTTPTTGATGVATNATITVNFSEAVNITAASFTLDCSGFTVGGTGTNIITLTPTGLLPNSTTCNVTVVAAQVSDVDVIDPPDTMAADYTFSFTTVPVADTAPSVTGTTPTNSAIGVPANTTINIAFSESVNVDTVGGTSFIINCAGAQTYAVTGSGTATITLTPTLNLPAATCTVTVVAANVTDVDAIDPPDVMAADYTFSFTTP